MANLKPTWAQTITPNPPIAGQPFTISGSVEASFAVVSVWSNPTCSGGAIFSALVRGPASYNFMLSGEPAGSYSVLADGGGCESFTIIPATSTTTPCNICIHVAKVAWDKPVGYEGKLISP